MNVKRVLLDTDIGNDVDDAFALAYLLSHPDCIVEGITTVSGKPIERASMASALCCAAGKSGIPIFPGTELPLLSEQLQPIPTQSDAIRGLPHEVHFEEAKAVRFMQDAIRANPGEISLLAIGPLTNIALLFSIDPTIPRLLKELVLMNGVFTYKLASYTCLAEWNARCDPHASALVYRATDTNVKVCGLDVTTQVAMDEQSIRARLHGSVGELLGRFLDARKDSSHPVTFHDPLAVATVFDTNIVHFRRGGVRVELQSSAFPGLTEWKEDPAANCAVAFEVDKDRFFNHYFTVLDGGACT